MAFGRALPPVQTLIGRPRLVRGVALGLAAGLVLLAAFSVWGARAMSADAERAADAAALHGLYRWIDDGVGGETQAAAAALTGPGSDARARYHQLTDSARRSLTELRDTQRGGHRDRAVALLAQQRRLEATMVLAFAPAQGAQPERASAIAAQTLTPLANRMNARVAAGRAEARSAREDASGSLDRLETAMSVATPLAVSGGLILLGFAAWLLTGAAGEIRRQSAQASHRSFHDGLTGLPNRMLLGDRVGQALRHGQRSGKPVTLMMIDLERFKEVNDTLGHVRGDALLRQASERIRGALRQSDTLARVGSDEFGVLLPETGDAGARMVAAKLVQALRAPCQLGGVSIVAEASIGIAHAPAHGAEFELLLRRADVALRQARERRAAYAVYDADRDPHDPRRLVLMEELRRGIERDELVLHYQPKVDAKTGALVGVEALVRWEHPTKGLLGPGQFVPLAEETGLIKPLTVTVLRIALRQCRTWHDAGLDIPVAVNLAVPSLLDPKLPGEVRDLLAQHGVDPSRLCLEITETSLMDDPQRAGACLEELAGMGARLAIDDFGTGYSSLGYLKRLPVSEIKIDRSFVGDMTRSPDDAAIVRATIDIARNLKLKVVAEGVETQDVWDELNALGCDVIQGFYVSRPVPAPELEEWLARNSGHRPRTLAAASAGNGAGRPNGAPAQAGPGSALQRSSRQPSAMSTTASSPASSSTTRSSRTPPGAITTRPHRPGPR